MTKKIVIDLEDGVGQIDGKRFEIDQSKCRLNVVGRNPAAKIEIVCEDSD